MDTHELAYIAGLVDGEGYIGLASAHGVLAGDYCSPQVMVGMTDEPIILWLHSKFPCNYRRKKPVKLETHKPCHMLQWRCTTAIEFLAAILPYLRVKRRQAELVIEMGRLPLSNERGRFCYQNPLPDSVRAERCRLFKLVKDLNRRGPLATPTA